MMAAQSADKLQTLARQLERDFLGGSIRLHILHHAQHEEVFGAGLIEELQRHGYRLSPGTLYPTLHALERGAYLRSKTRVLHGRRRRTYVATPTGKAVLVECRARMLELVRELFEVEEAHAPNARRKTRPEARPAPPSHVPRQSRGASRTRPKAIIE